MAVQVDAAGTFEARVGEPVVVRLPETPGTGYQWEVAEADGLDVESSEYEPPDSGAPGAGGHRVVRLTATSTGTGRLRMQRRRAWEPAAAETCEVVLNVLDDEGYQR